MALLFRLRLCISVALLSCLSAHGEQHGSALHDSKVTKDKDHIKEHLKEEIGDVKEEISDEDMQFHYFRLHDYDGNKKLDGLEIFKALSHYHNETGINDTSSTAEENMAETVDQILSYDDTNNDGYIDYPEYIKSQEEIRNGKRDESESH